MRFPWQGLGHDFPRTSPHPAAFMCWRASYSSPVNSQRDTAWFISDPWNIIVINIHSCCHLQPCCHHDLATPSRYLAVCHRICTNSLPSFFPLSLLRGGRTPDSGFSIPPALIQQNGVFLLPTPNFTNLQTFYVKPKRIVCGSDDVGIVLARK